VEDVTLSNLKLGLGLFAVGLTIFSQFYPKVPFPESAPFLKGCVLLYFALQGVLQLLHLLVEKDCILLTKRRKEGAAPAAAATTDTTDKKQQHQAPQSGKKGKKGPTVPAVAVASASSSADTVAPAAPSLPLYALSLQASLASKTAVYDLTLATRTSESVLASLSGSSSSTNSKVIGASGIPQVAVSVSLKVTDYFDVNGVFLMERYQAALASLLQAFSAEVAKVNEEGNSGSESKKDQ
jgi:hypothetical protein